MIRKSIITHDFNDQCAIMTDGAQGIGGAATARLVASGGRVAVWDIEKDMMRRTEAAHGDRFRGDQHRHRRCRISRGSDGRDVAMVGSRLDQEHIDYMLSKIPRGRILEVAAPAGMIVWLWSSESSFATGAVFDLSGDRATY